jgi:hypothetical protein
MRADGSSLIRQLGVEAKDEIKALKDELMAKDYIAIS